MKPSAPRSEKSIDASFVYHVWIASSKNLESEVNAHAVHLLQPQAARVFSGAHNEDEQGKRVGAVAPTCKLNYCRFSHASRVTKNRHAYNRLA